MCSIESSEARLSLIDLVIFFFLIRLQIDLKRFQTPNTNQYCENPLLKGS